MAWIVKNNGAGDGGYVVRIDGGDPLHAPLSSRVWREARRRAALPAEDPRHIDILPADPPPPPPTAADKLVAWRADPVNAALLEVLAADSGRTMKQIDDAIKANL